MKYYNSKLKLKGNHRSGSDATVLRVFGSHLLTDCSPFVEYPNLELRPWMCGASQKTFYSFDDPGVDQVERVTYALLSSPEFGTRCMSTNPIPSV
ncbi:hypothetical protein cypCar_00044746 [Cyprinus carpio]|nr:hypothetical protein cypCar_00044746 [Cyprinus carpio]